MRLGSGDAADGGTAPRTASLLPAAEATVGVQPPPIATGPKSLICGLHGRSALADDRVRGAISDTIVRDAENGPGPAHAAGHHRAWLRRYRIGLVATDLTAAAVAAFVAYLVRFTLINGGSDPALQARAYFVGALILPILWTGFVAANRAYEARFVGAGPAEFQRVFRAFLYLTVAVAMGSYATKAEIARGYILIALPTALALTLIGRYAARRALHRLRARGKAVRSVIMVGGVDGITSMSAVLRREVYAGMRVTGACIPIEQMEDRAVHATLDNAEIPLLGDIDSIREVAERTGADIIAVASSAEVGSEKLRWISWQLEGTPTHLVVAPGLIEVAGSRLHIQPVAGLPLLHVEQPQFTGARRLLKGAMDRAIAGAALIILSPLLLLVGATVRLSSKGPVLFRQVRVGRDGTTFTMYKFRSMAEDAEQRRIEIVDQDEGNGLLFKIRMDPRVTRVGRILRKYSIDEVPQLINVVNGTMSLVGPRPPLPEEVSQYGDDARRRLLVKPGVTGLWQISGRSDLSWDESMRLDLRYVENWSPTLDLMILWKTARAVVSGTGAY
jgi:exopolysaccharide biosynthesis polyprenyl glycosylphosphotransferase